MPTSWRRGLVVGGSSGIGEAIARELAESGTEVAIVARRGERIEAICESINARAGSTRARPFPGDVRDTASAGNMMNEIVESMGDLDIVVYAAGVLPPTNLNEYSTCADVDAILTNFAGAVAWLNAAAERFSREGRGTIVGVSSVAGERGRRANPVYNATKAALTSYLESLRNRLAHRGVVVVTAKPGFVKTAMTESRTVFPPAVSARTAAVTILHAAAYGRRVVYVPWWWRLIIIALKIIPASVMERLPI